MDKNERDEQAPDAQDVNPEAEDDVEGHNLGINPTIAQGLSRARSSDIDRAAKHRSLEREARQQRGR